MRLKMPSKEDKYDQYASTVQRRLQKELRGVINFKMILKHVRLFCQSQQLVCF